MANAIQIKRRASSGDPGAPNTSALKWGELAFNEADNTLYYGYGSGDNQAVSVPSIGGSGAYSLRGGTNATGTWPIGITGNAATVTSGVTYTGTPTAGYIPKFTDFDTIENGYQISSNLSTNNSSSFIPRADAVKTYVDSVKQGLDIKDSVVVLASSSIGGTFDINSNSLTTEDTSLIIDGVTLQINDRLLVIGQENAEENGIYIVTHDVPEEPVVLVRSLDADSIDKINPGMFVFVEKGAYSDTGWVLTTNNPITLNSTGLTFSQFSAAGQIYDGSGLYKQGNTIGVGTADSGRIVINENNIDLAIVPQNAITLGTAGTAFIQSFTVDSYGRVTDRTAASIQNATTSSKGIAQFDSNNFDVVTGTVSLQNVVSTTGNQTISGVKTFHDGDTTSINIQTTLGGSGFINFMEGPYPRMSLLFDGVSNELLVKDSANTNNFKFKITTLTSLRASGTAENSTHIPLFIADPTTNSQVLCHKSKSDFISDLGIASTNVTLTAGSGLSGGGDLTSNQTFNVNTGYGLDISSDNVVVDTTEVVVTTGNQDISGVKNFFNFCSFNSGIVLSDHGFAIENIVDDIGATFVIDRNGIITDGKWDAQTIDVDAGGTGQTSYTNGQLLIGNTAGTLTKATLTQGTAISITNGNGAITVAHADTSTYSGQQATSGVSSITVDAFGHVTGVTEANYVTAENLCTSISSCPINGGTF